MEWLNKINEAIEYVEANITEKVDYTQMAKIACCSLSQFQNIFLFLTGITLSEYVRRRRMALSASELIHNANIKIIDLSLKYGYDSHAAFTRSFKEFHGVSPSNARKIKKYIDYSRISLKINIMGGFIMNTNSITNSAIKGWLQMGTTPEKYRFYLDDKVYHTGTKSASVKSILDEYQSGDFATLMQTFKAKDFLGKRVRFSGFVKSQEIEEWCGLWMRIDDNSGSSIKFDNMQNRPIKGTTEWTQYSVVLDVPDNSLWVNIGILVIGKGQVWLDNISFEEVGCDIPTTDIMSDCNPHDSPVNLSFEENTE